MRAGAYRVFLPLFLVSYCAAGFLTHSQFGGREVFPVFSWGLYADASRTEVQYTARVIEIDGQPLETAVDLLDTPAFHRAPDYWRDVGVMTRFGAALDEGDRAGADALRRLFEANVLPGSSVRYEMVKRTYNPLERRASGALRESSLGVFLKDGRAVARR